MAGPGGPAGRERAAAHARRAGSRPGRAAGPHGAAGRRRSAAGSGCPTPIGPPSGRPPGCTTSARSAVPGEILTKSGPLDDAEWAFLRQCPAIGERIATAAAELAPLAPIIRACREWYDGSGYPDGLAGEAIPLGARVIAACSAVAAMTATRPYAAAWDLLRVTVELRRLAGAQFDPAVVTALLDELHAVDDRARSCVQ